MPGFLCLVVGAVAALLVAIPAGQAHASHVGCGDTVTENTRLDSDLIDCPGDGIVIGASGITLDLDGHVVDGDGGTCDTGIVNGREPCTDFPTGADGYARVTVRNGAVREFSFGVQVMRADAAALLGLRVSDNSGYAGMVLGQLSNSLIRGNRVVDTRRAGGNGIIFHTPTGPNAIVDNVTARNSDFGIDIVSAKRPTRVEGNTSFGNSDGIHASSSEGNVLRDNRVFANAAEGIDASDGVVDNVIQGNWAWENGIAGIGMGEGAHRNRVARNVVFRNALAPYAPGFVSGGIILWEGEGNAWVGNRVFGNGGLAGLVIISVSRDNIVQSNEAIGNRAHGILIGQLYEDAGHMVISANLASRNGADGIHISSEYVDIETHIRPTEVQRNRVDRNGDDGIDVLSDKVALAANKARRNSDYGIEAIPGVFDGGANRAFGNGNPLQCLNVFCR